jgi:hypothetical protein
MGIRFYCPNGHKLNVKEFQAGRRGICPYCGEKILIPTESTRPSSKEERQARRAGVQAVVTSPPTAAETSPTAAAPASPVPSSPAAAGSVPDGAMYSSPGPAAEGISPSVEPQPYLSAPLAASASAMPSRGGARPKDPLEDAEEVVWYVRPPSGGQFGPATPVVMRVWLTEGRISPDTLVWREGWRDWQEASVVFAQLKSAANSPMASVGAGSRPMAVPVSAARSTSVPTAHKPRLMLWIAVALVIVSIVAAAGIFWLMK